MASQTIEDGEPRHRPDWTWHRDGTPEAFMRMELPVRLPWNTYPRTRVVIRCYQTTGEATMSLEGIRVE